MSNTQLEMIKDYLDKKSFFIKELPDILNKLVEAITGDLPYKMKVSIAASECVVFASQMRRNIILQDGTKVPTNAISFVLSSSGTNKDRTANAVRKCFSSGYNLINEYRDTFAIAKAKIEAEDNGDSDPDTTFKRYYQKPKPLFASVGTVEGMISYMNKLEQDEWGAAYIYSGELGSELQTSSIIVDNIRLLSEMYDLGKKEVKIIKSEEHQSEEIKNLPFSALFIGSQENILYDESVKNKFKLEFTTKLARRSFFNFNKYDSKKVDFKSMEERLTYRRNQEQSAIVASRLLNERSIDIVNNTPKDDLKLSNEAYTLFMAYMEYNDELSSTISNIYPISKLVRKHAQWRALKLAGAFAVLDCSLELTAEHYKQAAYFVEMLDEDMVDFENELSKEKYEVFADYMEFISKDNKSHISLHDLKKMSFIPSTVSSKNKVEELITMANSFKSNAIFTVVKDGVDYEKIEKSYKVGVSFKKCKSTNKIDRAKESVDGFKYLETDFSKLDIMLKGNYSFLPFELTDGVRSSSSVNGSTKWICLDVDNSDITAEEAADILGDYKYHIARTSNVDNPFKFRLLMELDSIVNVKDIHWKKFIKSISNEIGITVDLLPKAQLYLGYKDRVVISNLDGEMIETKKHLLACVETKKEKHKTKAQANAELNNKQETFFYAWDAENGGRSLALIRAAKHAYDLGADQEYIKELILEINSYWIDKLDDKEIERTIFSQVDRWDYK